MDLDALLCMFVMIILVVGRRHSPHLSFTDDEEGVSSGPLSDDVLSIFIMCLSENREVFRLIVIILSPLSYWQCNVLVRDEPYY